MSGVKRYEEWGCCEHGNVEPFARGETCVSSADYDALAAELAEVQSHLDNWYRTEAAVHSALTKRFGGDAMLQAIGEAADMVKHNPIMARIAQLEAALTQYGQHLSHCDVQAWHNHHPLRPCNCGLHVAKGITLETDGQHD